MDKAGVKRPGGKRAGKTPRKDVKDETSRSSVVIRRFLLISRLMSELSELVKHLVYLVNYVTFQRFIH